MRFEDRVVSDVQNANDIVDIIGQYVPLKRSGRNLKANCPFHQEKSPSFMVHPEKQIFHCFGCGAGGDVFSFVMRHENMTFPEALRFLAERANIRLPEKTNAAAGEKNETEKLYAAYRLAADFYHERFMDPQHGKAAREYWKKRGYSDELAVEFKVGWASVAWQDLCDFLSKKGAQPDLLVKSGLIQRSAQGRLYDSFRGRILFPIQNLQGKVVGFGGRLIGDGEGPKYLNSSENPIFRKRRELFGLHLAKKHIDQLRPQLIVVEGYMDFFRLYAAGFKASVATLGTALTPEHVRLMKRFAEEAVVIYDGDKAGEAASLRGLEVFLEEGMSVKLVRMPPDVDPDDFLRDKGAPAFRAAVEAAQDFFDYKLEILLQRYNVREPLGLMRVTNDFLETFSKIKSSILLSHYVRRLATALNLDENSIRTELGKLTKTTGRKEPAAEGSPGEAVSSETVDLPREEVLLLSLMMEHSTLRQKAVQQLKDENFNHPSAKQAFSLLVEWQTQAIPFQASAFLNRIRNEDLKRQLAAVLAMEEGQQEPSKVFEDCLRYLRKRHVHARMDHLRREIAKAEQEGNPAKVGVYLKEYQALLQEGR